MTPSEQGRSSLSGTSPIVKPPDVDDHLTTNYSGDHYSTPATTHMMINKPYSHVPDNGALYSSAYGSHQPAGVLPSPPPFIHNTINSPSPSVNSTYSNQPPPPPPPPLPHHHHHHHHHYANASQQQQQPSSAHPTLRTVYLGNIASDIQISDILDQVRSGTIEMARPFPEKNCLFLTFVDASAAAHFYYQVSNRPFTINGGSELKIGWGKPSAMPTSIRLAIQNGASRNVFLGSLDESINEDVIREDLKPFGTIEHVRLIREKNIAFVHFLSITNAIKCVNNLPNEGDWQTRRVYYGKDRCCQHQQLNNHHGSSSSSSNPSTTPMYPNTAYTSLSQPPPHYHSHSLHHPHLQHAYQVRYAPSITYDPYTGATIETYTTASPSSIAGQQRSPHYPSTQSPVVATAVPAVTPHQHDQQQHLPPSHPTATMVPLHGGDMTMYPPPPLTPSTGTTNPHSLTGVANRTIYLGNIHPDTTCEEICNVVRGGILSQIRYMSDKHIAFIAFVDPVLALEFFTQANCHGIIIKNRRLKIGWGKPSNLAGNVIQAVLNGGSRNVYLGNMDSSSTMTEEKLLQDFSEYGDIELVNTLKEKNCAFVNFTSIAAAIRAIEGIRTKEEYKRFRINYGKDRCGNPPRSYTAPSTNGLIAPPNNTLSTDQNLILLNSSSSESTTNNNPAMIDSTTTLTTTNMDVGSVADLMASTLRLPHSDVEEQSNNNGVLKSSIH